MFMYQLKNWAMSSYEDDLEERINYYINERQIGVGDDAYVYYHKTDRLYPMEIVEIISRSNDAHYYDSLIEDSDVLIKGENLYRADVGAEFITDNDCYLVWFNYI